jgi:hypothetical protein
VEKQTSVTYFEYVLVALDTQYSMRMLHIFICGLSGCTTFSHIILYIAGFQKKVIEHKTRVLIVSTILSEIFIILRKIERDMTKPLEFFEH